MDKKSLRMILGKSPDWAELAKDCVAFANSAGGTLVIGIEDGHHEPPPEQKIPRELLERVIKRIHELTVHVHVSGEILAIKKGAEVMQLTIYRSPNVASTSDGRYYLRVADSCVPVLGDEVLRLAAERPGRPWEVMDSHIPITKAWPSEQQHLIQALRSSDRTKPSVKQKSDAQLLQHYGMVHEGTLTHLGALLIGGAVGRRAVGTAPLLHAIKYDGAHRKINKWSWDDHELSPIDLVDAVWREIPDFRESYEVNGGMFRRQIPAYDEIVLREMLVNALVHRPYTQQGDLFLNLYPDHLELVNPGRLPLGVTPRNILHASRRRNDGLARIFHDIGLCEREGSGYDLMYDRLLSQGRPVPVIEEGPDWVKVTIQRSILMPDVLHFVAEADLRYDLRQKERIVLGLLALGEGMSAKELANSLDAPNSAEVVHWIGRLLDFKLVQQTGKTSATRYFVDPAILRTARLDGLTTLARIQPHRLRALILEDLSRYPGSSNSQINRRIGAEIPSKTIKRMLDTLVEAQVVSFAGERRWRTYTLKPSPT